VSLSNNETLDRPQAQQSIGVHHNSIAELVRAALEAWALIDSGDVWARWMTIGEALMAGRTEAMRTAHIDVPTGRRYNEEFGDWLKSTGLGKIFESTLRKRLMKCMEHREEIEEWLKGLPAERRAELNHPAVVLRNWRKTLSPKSDDTAKPKLSPVEKLKAAIIKLEEENHRLKQSAPFSAKDTNKDIGNYIWRTVGRSPEKMRGIARACDRIAREAEKADTAEAESSEKKAGGV
jgi:hypothetical protein